MFLPKKDPLTNYKSSSKSLDRISDIANQLPKLLLTGRVQETIDNLKVNDLSIKHLIKNNDMSEIFGPNSLNITKLANAKINWIRYLIFFIFGY